MKFFYFFIFSLVWTISSAYSQYNAGGTQFYVGPKASISATRYSPGKNLPNVPAAHKTKIDYAAGVLYKFTVNDYLSLHGEFNYARKTRSVKDSAKTSSYKNKHIDAPILFELNFPAKNKYIGDFEYYFNVGPQISYWLNGEGKTTLNGEEEAAQSTYLVNFKEQGAPMAPNNLNRFQYGFILGSGVTLPSVGDNYFVLELRYFFCQTYLGDSYSTVINDVTYNDDLRGNYQLLSLSFSYTFGLNFMPNSQGSGVKMKTVVK